MDITDAMVEAAIEAWENVYEAELHIGSPTYTDNKEVAMRAALTAAISAGSTARVTDTDAAEALKPFTTFAEDAIERSDALWVWKSNIFRDRVCDWFGPSDFGLLLHFSKSLASIGAGEQEGWRLVPVEPSRGRLISMAIRGNHAFLINPDPNVKWTSGVKPEHRESVLRSMRQLYEEAIGEGFYSSEKEQSYIDSLERSMRPAAPSEHGGERG